MINDNFDMFRAFLYLFVFIAIQFGVQMLAVAVYSVVTRQLPTALPAWLYVVILVVYSLVTIVVFLSARWFRASRSYVRSGPWLVLVWSAIAALGAIVPSMCLQDLLPEWTGWAKEMVDETEQQLSDLMLLGPAGYIVIALLPPVVEEMVFRGCVLHSLLKWRPQRRWLMIGVSALVFALIHLNPAQMPHAFLIGLLLGWMYARTGSIVPGVVYHWVNNSAAYVMFHVFQNPEHASDLFGPGMSTLLLAFAFGLCILLPALYQLNLHMKPAPEQCPPDTL